MNRLILVASLASVLALGALSGCKAKPSETACREAIANIREIRELDNADVGADPRAAVRSCRAQSSKATVECYRTAKSEAELDRCRAEGGGIVGEDTPTDGDNVGAPVKEEQPTAGADDAAAADDTAAPADGGPAADSAAAPPDDGKKAATADDAPTGGDKAAPAGDKAAPAGGKAAPPGDGKTGGAAETK